MAVFVCITNAAQSAKSMLTACDEGRLPQAMAGL